MTQLIPRGAMDRACVLFSDLVEGRWEHVDGEFDASLRGNVDLAREWATVADSAGSFERIDAPSSGRGGYKLAVPGCRGRRGIGEVVFAGPTRSPACRWNFPMRVRVGRSIVGISGRKEQGGAGS